MSTSNTPSDGPATEREFQQALSRLILIARDNGVTVRGGWVIDDQDGSTDFGVEIYRVLKDRSLGEDRNT